MVCPHRAYDICAMETPDPTFATGSGGPVGEGQAGSIAG